MNTLRDLSWYVTDIFFPGQFFIQDNSSELHLLNSWNGNIVDLYFYIIWNCTRSSE